MSIHPPDDQALNAALQRAQALDDTILAALNTPDYRPYSDSPRISTSVAAASVAFEHGRAVRALIAQDMVTSALSLIRLQHEALTRAVWAFYAATDLAIDKLSAPLSKDTEAVANKLPMLNDMLKAIQGKAPEAATLGLLAFKDNNNAALNSFVHGGIHALQRHTQGYPLPLVRQAIHNGNGLQLMAAMMLAVLTNNPVTTRRIGALQAEFVDCLPSPLPQAQRI